jgi:hypothetical protein
MLEAFPDAFILGQGDNAPARNKRERAWYASLQKRVEGQGVVRLTQSPLDTYIKATGMKGSVYQHAPATNLAFRIMMKDEKRPYVIGYSYILDKLREADSQIKLDEVRRKLDEKIKLAEKNRELAAKIKLEEVKRKLAAKVKLAEKNRELAAKKHKLAKSKSKQVAGVEQECKLATKKRKQVAGVEQECKLAAKKRKLGKKIKPTEKI